MFLSSIFKKKIYKKKIFTYYIPAPPNRRSGYQEKEFDALIEHIQKLGFEVLDFKLQSHSTEEKSGLWVICILSAPNKDVWKQTIDFDYHIQTGESLTSIPLDPSIIHE